MGQRWPTVLFALAMASIPFVPGMPPFWIVLLDNIGLSALVAMGLVLLTGVGGLTSFGQAAFCGFGAYTTAVLTTAYGLSPWLTLPLALLVSGVAAVALLAREGADHVDQRDRLGGIGWRRAVQILERHMPRIDLLITQNAYQQLGCEIIRHRSQTNANDDRPRRYGERSLPTAADLFALLAQQPTGRGFVEY